jgi:macrocin-O-methyltransferase TylF-like protien
MSFIKTCAKGALRRMGWQLLRARTPSPPHYAYCEDHLFSRANCEFTLDPAFITAYERGMKAAYGKDWCWRWRVYIGLWAAQNAIRLEGDFVECGVGNGFLSSAIMKDLDWNGTGRQFYLLDSFEGVNMRCVSESERTSRDFEAENKKNLADHKYATSFEHVKENFSEWNNVNIIKGFVPGSLSECGAKSVSYLHLDMNCSAPEVAALDFFWDKLVPGAFVLLDDYAMPGCSDQKTGIDEYVAEKGFRVLSVPTGQGLLVVSK